MLPWIVTYNLKYFRIILQLAIVIFAIFRLTQSYNFYKYQSRSMLKRLII